MQRSALSECMHGLPSIKRGAWIAPRATRAEFEVLVNVEQAGLVKLSQDLKLQRYREFVEAKSELTLAVGFDGRNGKAVERGETEAGISRNAVEVRPLGRDDPHQSAALARASRIAQGVHFGDERQQWRARTVWEAELLHGGRGAFQSQPGIAPGIDPTF